MFTRLVARCRASWSASSRELVGRRTVISASNLGSSPNKRSGTALLGPYLLEGFSRSSCLLCLPSHSATIQGLGVALENPEQIAKWVEERKKRWPSAATVAEKVRTSLSFGGHNHALNRTATRNGNDSNASPQGSNPRDVNDNGLPSGAAGGVGTAQEHKSREDILRQGGQRQRRLTWPSMSKLPTADPMPVRARGSLPKL